VSIHKVLDLIRIHGAENVALVVNHSGGKDSQRMLGYIRQHFPGISTFPDLATYVVMADTGFEHTKPISAEAWARAAAARFGLPLTVVRNPRKTYLEMVEARRKFPSPSCRQCTSDLKRDPIAKFIRKLPQRVIINCTGIRAEESAARAKQKPWKLNRRLSRAGRVVWEWMPIFDQSLQDVLTWHWYHGQPLHPVYVPEYHCDGTTGGWLRRFSCRVCIFATDADLRAIHTHDREAFDIVADLERRIGFTMRPNASLFQIIGQ
jgi:3'-phosphoadenosine 5'-phosphosulfate sulfotransferase (PAPS reductase)/FAD synthetase